MTNISAAPFISFQISLSEEVVLQALRLKMLNFLQVSALWLCDF